MHTSEYNQFSQVQASVREIVNGLIQKYFPDLNDSEHEHQTVTIIEYGCSGGRNTPAPLSSIFSKIHNIPSNVMIYLNDLPRNDFRIVMEAIETAKKENRFLPNDKTWNEYIFTVPKSFYQQVVPSNSIDYSYCLHAVHWAEEVHCPIEGGMNHRNSIDPSKNELWLHKAAESWLQFLRCRELELKTNAPLIIITLAYVDENNYAMKKVQNHTYEILKSMVNEQKITTKEMNSLVFQLYYRTRDDILEPFKSGQVNFEVEHYDLIETPCPFYPVLLQDGNIKKFAGSVIGTGKTLFYDNQVGALVREGRDPKEAAKIVEELWGRNFAEAMAHPEESKLNLLNHFIVLKKK